jgi:hypothetical protein
MGMGARRKLEGLNHKFGSTSPTNAQQQDNKQRRDDCSQYGRQITAGAELGGTSHPRETRAA